MSGFNGKVDILTVLGLHGIQDAFNPYAGAAHGGYPMQAQENAGIKSIAEEAAVLERSRILKILEGEIARGRSLIGLQDMKGKPVFDDATTQACIEALQYCASRIAGLDTQPKEQPLPKGETNATD